MFELEIKGARHPFNFGMGFLRNVDKKVQIPVEGAPHLKQDVGLRNIIGRLLDGDVKALVEVLYEANYKLEPKVTCDMLDEHIDDPNTDIDKLFDTVLDFLEQSNATRKTMQEMKKLYEAEMKKASQ